MVVLTFQMWCDMHTGDQLDTVVRTNNGLERQNEALKYEYLVGYKNCSLSEFLTVLVTQFFPDAYLK